jgi:hypothetical protein
MKRKTPSLGLPCAERVAPKDHPQAKAEAKIKRIVKSLLMVFQSPASSQAEKDAAAELGRRWL